jgi:aminoglycoside phosphotransferase (APT) family kinase protein
LAAGVIDYLTTVRAACEAVMQTQGDPLTRRRLEQVCHVLATLICDAKSSPRLEARALDRFRRLVGPHQSPAAERTEDFDGARTLVAKLIESPEAIRGADAIDFCKEAVEIEREYVLGQQHALREESQSVAGAASGDSRSASPDAGALSLYLSGVFAQPVSVSEVNAVSLGYSKATYLLGIRASGDLPSALVIRMDRPFNFLGTTVIDEYPILRVLHESGVSVPRPYALEDTGRVLGQPFLVVSRVYGGNVGSHFSFPPRNAGLCAQIGAKLAQIHRVPVEKFGPRLRGAAQSPREQIAGEIARYHADWSSLHAVSPTMEAAFRWIRQHAEDAVSDARTLVHGDYSLSNLLISDEGEIAAILDWEFTQLGPPAADIGWFFTAAERLASFKEFLAAYRAAGGRVPPKEQLDFFILWGLVRLAVMNFQVDSGIESGRMHDIKHAYAAITFTRECVGRVGACLSELLSNEARTV